MKPNNAGLFLAVFFCLVLLSSFVISDSAFGDKIIEEEYEISRSKVERTLAHRTIFEDIIEITNKRTSPIEVSFSVKGSAAEIISYKNSSIIVEPDSYGQWNFDIIGQSVSSVSGTISLSGDIIQEIPINITVVSETQDPLFLVDVSLLKNYFILGKKIEFKVDLTRLKPIAPNNLTLTYFLNDLNNNSYLLGSEDVSLDSSLQLLNKFEFPEEAIPGFYTLYIQTNHSEGFLESKSLLEAKISFFKRKLFGLIPFWLVFTILGFLSTGLLAFILIRRHILSKRKYKMTLDMKTLPKEDKKFLWLGKIAEKKDLAYLDPHRLTTHAIVAGATGGGKSIAAQVLIEEALKQDIAVLVFDPTAQWSGMLRKCEDKKMISFYQGFGMKPTDARGFPGNIRAVKDPRQIIEVEKFFKPGNIQIFTLNKLKPKDMDVFVANVIRGIFESDPKEYPTLRILLVFDEVHRLLPKFGGSGEGFVQIERACREFRKWGYGVMLVSQVLSDFVGEIKANISTEIQMRTRDEGDLNRIKTKFGEEFLQSLVKASIGVGMFVNPAYNHANPYFVQFRPILHNTRRLSDEELEKYNQYNDRVDDLEYQIEQLEELKIDVFDLKMELKLVKDKIMVGNFSVVDIYLEGLLPRIKKQWEKLGKAPKKKELKLVNLEDLKKAVDKAKEESEKAKEKTKAEEQKITEQKKDPLKELDEKIVAPLTLDNGMMISSLKELKTAIPNIDDEVWKIHVNEQKNEIANWFSENYSKVYGARLNSIKEKEEFLKQLSLFKGEEKATTPTTPANQKPETKKPVTPSLVQESKKPLASAVQDSKKLTPAKIPEVKKVQTETKKTETK